MHHLDLAVAAKQSARVRELLMEDAKRQAPLFQKEAARRIMGPQHQARSG